MTSGISGWGSSSQLNWLLQAARQNSASSVDSFTSGTSSSTSSSGTTSTSASSSSASTSASDTTNPFQQLSSEIQNLLLALQSLGSNSSSSASSGGTTGPFGPPPPPGPPPDQLTSSSDSSSSSSTVASAYGPQGFRGHHHDSDGDNDGSAVGSASDSSSSSSASTPFASNQVQTDLGKLLADLQNAIQSYGSTAQASSVSATTQVAA